MVQAVASEPQRDAASIGHSYRPISDYAVIGNCRTIALVSRRGEIDFLCLPRFDGPTVFAAILDSEKGGSFFVRPAAEFTSTRRYLGATNVLETTFTTATGQAVLTDAMPVSSAKSPREHLWPDHELIRRIQCTRGEIELCITCDPRPSYARITPTPRRLLRDGWVLESRAQTLLLRSEVPLDTDPKRPGVHGAMRLRAGERRFVSLSSDSQVPAVLPSLGELAEHRLGVTLDYWRDWASRCASRGPWRDIVLRSALALKLLCFAPAGSLIAAATTSLPEWIGGARNWDYRYCWLRDASFVTRSLLQLGYSDEAQSFIGWLLHATRLTWPRLHVMYSVYGNTDLDEGRLDDLEGYRGSRPVRIGNAAHDQLQLDTYGAVVDAAYRFVLQGGRLDRVSGRMLAGLGRTAAALWREPDEGIWEPRSGPAHHTLSKAMCCIAMERLLTLHERGQIRLKKRERDRFTEESVAIREAILAQGVDPHRGCFTSTFGSDDTDASLLLLSIYGFEDGKSPRMLATIDRVLGALSASPADAGASPDRRGSPSPLLYRYHAADGIRGGEGAFGICCFWAVEALAMAGRTDEATARFEALCRYASDVGLLAEEIDPATGDALGNFPQAFTHVGLINAAHTLAEVRADPPSPAEQQAAGRLA